MEGPRRANHSLGLGWLPRAGPARWRQASASLSTLAVRYGVHVTGRLVEPSLGPARGRSHQRGLHHALVPRGPQERSARSAPRPAAYPRPAEGQGRDPVAWRQGRPAVRQRAAARRPLHAGNRRPRSAGRRAAGEKPLRANGHGGSRGGSALVERVLLRRPGLGHAGHLPCPVLPVVMIVHKLHTSLPIVPSDCRPVNPSARPSRANGHALASLPRCRLPRR